MHSLHSIRLSTKSFLPELFDRIEYQKTENEISVDFWNEPKNIFQRKQWVERFFWTKALREKNETVWRGRTKWTLNLNNICWRSITALVLPFICLNPFEKNMPPASRFDIKPIYGQPNAGHPQANPFNQTELNGQKIEAKNENNNARIKWNEIMKKSGSDKATNKWNSI